MRRLMLTSMLMILSVFCHAQEPEEHTLFVGEFENRTGIVNPLLDFLSDTLSFLFSRSELAKIHPISPGLRSAYLQRARNEQPNVDAIRINLLAAEYARADAVLVGFYTKAGGQWAMEAELYVIREGSRAWESIQPAGKDVYSLLDNLAAEVSKRLGTGQYMLLSTRSWEAYQSYRQGHQAYYNFDLMGAIRHFQQAMDLDSRLAIAQAELGLSYAMISKFDEARAAFAQAAKNLQYASEQEQLVVMGLESFYRYYWVLKEGGYSGADMPRMREDTAWDEPWLHRYIGMMSEDKTIRDSERRLWLLSATAYAKAGFYSVPELVYAGTKECIDFFDSSRDPQFLEAALQFITQAADLEANDEYDDIWKNWELASIYGKMSKPVDVQNHRERWLQAVKRKPLDSFAPDALNDLAGKCLEMGASEDALEFAAKAVELEPNVDERMFYMVTLADAHLASGGLAKAFNAYTGAFEASQRGDASTRVLSNSLSKLAQLVMAHPGFVNERRTELNEVINAIGDTDSSRFRGDSAQAALYSGGTLIDVWRFCHAVGDMEPLLGHIHSLLSQETSPLGQLVYLSDLVMLTGSVGESERNWLSSPEFIQSIAAINSPLRLGWVYEMIGERGKAMEAYKGDLESESPEVRMIASCVLMSLRHNLGEEVLSQPHVYFEAEEPESFTPYFEIAEAPEASRGRYLWVPDTFDGSHDSQGKAEYEFEIADPGNYRLVARMLGEFLHADGVRVSIGSKEVDLGIRSGRAKRDLLREGEIPVAIELSEPPGHRSSQYAAWEWVPANEVLKLPAGKHRLVVHNKDDGVKLDCMVLSYLRK